MSVFNYQRRVSSVVEIGTTPLGGEHPIRIQTMGNVSTMDTEAAVAQSVSMIEAGAEYIRFTAQGERESRNLGEIKRRLRAKGYHTPLVADIHFNPRAADAAAEEVEKVRINPGNYVDRVKTFSHIQYTDQEYAAEIEKIRERFLPFLRLCKQNHTAIRIGVNHGSLSDRIMSRYGDTPQGMVASCMEFLQICREENFPHVVISIKASNTVIMVQTVRLLVKTMEEEGMNYPLHLGVTEAGEGEDGRVKSAVGIGALLMDGIGDTIRVSLSEDPEAEIPVARKLIDYVAERKGLPVVEGKSASGYDPVRMQRRKSRSVLNIGGGALSVVISERTDNHFEFTPDRIPDYLYIGQEDPEKIPDHISVLVDARFWKPLSHAYPFFTVSEVEDLAQYDVPLKFLGVTCEDLSDSLIETIKKDPALVLILSAYHPDKLASQRAAFHRLMDAGCDVPVIIQRNYNEKDTETLQIKAGADFGLLLLDGFQDGIMLTNSEGDPQISENCMFGILQATRTRISKTEYISCPGCGRTLYDLQSTIARVKEGTSHLKGLKIGIMGCIVNGPGEMADADYGYVGSGRGKIDLYKGKECIRRNVPENEAVQQLIELIKENGDWHN